MMYVRTIMMEIHIHGALTLKDKRQVLKSMMTRLHQRLFLAVAETGYQDEWQRAELGIAMVTSRPGQLDIIQQNMLTLIETQYPVEIIHLTATDY